MPLGHFGVRLHQPIVDVLVLSNFRVLVLAEAVDQVLETGLDLVPVVEENVDQRRRVDGEEEQVDCGVPCAKVGGTVGFVLGRIEDAPIVDCSRHVVVASRVVEDAVRVDGQEARPVGVGVVHAQDGQKSQEGADEFVKSREEGDHERIRVVEK